jgi:flavin reductase (DIM6/NTAB) family NADH-FMN oxidoreductase RutF
MYREIALHLAHRLLSARPTCLLTTQYKGQVNVMTIAWVCPASLQPPLVVLAIHPSCYTHDMLKKSEECILSIPSRKLGHQVMQCGRLSGNQVDKVQAAGLLLDSGNRVEVPRIEGSLAHLECVLNDVVGLGDHSLFVAEVIGAWAEEEAFDDTWLLPNDEELRPLHHLGGSDFCSMGARFPLL